MFRLFPYSYRSQIFLIDQNVFQICVSDMNSCPSFVVSLLVCIFKKPMWLCPIVWDSEILSVQRVYTCSIPWTSLLIINPLSSFLLNSLADLGNRIISADKFVSHFASTWPLECRIVRSTSRLYRTRIWMSYYDRLLSAEVLLMTTLVLCLKKVWSNSMSMPSASMAEMSPFVMNPSFTLDLL